MPNALYLGRLIEYPKQTETVCNSLRGIGLNASEYHAGLHNDIRTNVQERFMKAKNIVVSSELPANCERAEHGFC